MFMLRRNPRKGYLFVLFPKLDTVPPNNNIQQLERQYNGFHNFYIVNYCKGCPKS